MDIFLKDLENFYPFKGLIFYSSLLNRQFFTNKNNTRHIKYTSFLKEHVVSDLQRSFISAPMDSWAIAEEGYSLMSRKAVKPET